MNISNMNNIESRVQSYWTKRAHNFNIVRKNELNSSISERWREEIVHFLPEGKVLQILDVGTGTGYFAILLSQIGHQVTGIDLTDAMLKEARDNAALYQVHPTFQQMDAQKLAFLDQSFDVVISRNLTWTLPDPEAAYREWMRVLKKGGILLNFDADYASNIRNHNTSASHISDTEVYGHCGVTPELEQENASITLSMNEPETASLLGSGISGKHRLFQIRIRPFRRSEYLKRARPERCSYVPCMGCAVIILPHRP